MKKGVFVLLAVVLLLVLVVPAASAAPAGKACWYRVKKGDTLSGIAYQYGTTFRYLAKLNGIRKPWVIRTGRWLQVPCRPDVKKPCRAWHRVQRGDTVWQISVWYCSSIKAIKNANGLASPKLIYPGQSLCIPRKPNVCDP